MTSLRHNASFHASTAGLYRRTLRQMMIGIYRHVIYSPEKGETGRTIAGGESNIGSRGAELLDSRSGSKKPAPTESATCVGRGHSAVAHAIAQDSRQYVRCVMDREVLLSSSSRLEVWKNHERPYSGPVRPRRGLPKPTPCSMRGFSSSLD